MGHFSRMVPGMWHWGLREYVHGAGLQCERNQGATEALRARKEG